MLEVRTGFSTGSIGGIESKNSRMKVKVIMRGNFRISRNKEGGEGTMAKWDKKEAAF